LPRIKKVNPYTPGAAQRPSVFVGRRRQFSVVDALADQLEEGYPAEDYVFTGLRGMGKTVFLKEIGDRSRSRGGCLATTRPDVPTILGRRSRTSSPISSRRSSRHRGSSGHSARRSTYFRSEMK